MLLSLTGCSVLLRKTPVPIPTQTALISTSEKASTLVVFLPGRGDSIGVFERQGFLAVLREAGVKVDAIAVDAHLGYYYKKTIIERLQADVLLPARQQGYRRIVLVGVSLGGLGALLNERENPGSVDALILLGAYLGDNAGLFERIAAAGGPALWATGRNPYYGGVEEQIWTYLGMRSTALPVTWLLCGQKDSYGPGQRLLAGLLPATRVITIPGGHDWPTWLALWRGVCFQSDLFVVEKVGGILLQTGESTFGSGDRLDAR